MYVVSRVGVDVRGQDVRLLIETSLRMSWFVVLFKVNIAQHKQFVSGRGSCTVDVSTVDCRTQIHSGIIIGSKSWLFTMGEAFADTRVSYTIWLSGLLVVSSCSWQHCVSSIFITRARRGTIVKMQSID